MPFEGVFGQAVGPALGVFEDEGDGEVHLVADDAAVVDQDVHVLDPAALDVPQRARGAAHGLVDGGLEALLIRGADLDHSGDAHGLRASFLWLPFLLAPLYHSEDRTRIFTWRSLWSTSSSKPPSTTSERGMRSVMIPSVSMVPTTLSSLRTMSFGLIWTGSSQMEMIVTVPPLRVACSAV